MTMGLINGMDDVIAYIQKVEKENKELKEALAVSEKPSLKQCLSEAMKENGSWMTDMKKDYEVQLRTQKDMVSMYSKKYRKLKEENETLEERIQSAGERHREEYLATIQNFKEAAKEIAELKKENEELKEEYELGGKELKEQLNEESQQRLTNKECWMKVQKQYHELKEKYETLEYQYDMEKQCHLEDLDDKQAEIDDLENTIEGERLTHRQVVQDKEAEIEELQKYAEIMGDIDGDDLSNLLSDYGWEYNDDGKLEKKQ